MEHGAGTSHRSNGTSQPGVSIQEAAVLLGVSPNTIRRWCQTGRLRSEQVSRPQGYAVRVYLEGETFQVPPEVPPGEVPGDLPNQVPPTSHQQVPTDLQRAEAMAAYSTALLAPLVAELSTTRVKLVEQAETIGSLRAQLAVAEERIHSLEAPRSPVAPHLTAQAPDPTTETPEPPRRPDPVPPLWPAPAPVPPDEDGHQPPEPNGHTAWWRRWWVALAGR